MVLVSIFSSEKNQLQIGKNWKKMLNWKNLLKKTRAKTFDATFSFERSQQNPRTNYENMDSVFVVGPEI